MGGARSAEVEATASGNKQSSELDPRHPWDRVTEMPHLDAREKSLDIFVQSKAARNLGPNHGHVGQGENDTVAFCAPRKLLGDEVPSHEFLAESRVVEHVLLGGTLLCSLEVRLNDDLVNVLDESV